MQTRASSVNANTRQELIRHIQSIEIHCRSMFLSHLPLKQFGQTMSISCQHASTKDATVANNHEQGRQWQDNDIPLITQRACSCSQDCNLISRIPIFCSLSAKSPGSFITRLPAYREQDHEKKIWAKKSYKHLPRRYTGFCCTSHIIFCLQRQCYCYVIASCQFSTRKKLNNGVSSLILP